MKFQTIFFSHIVFLNNLFYRTPLHAAVKGGNRSIIQLLYEDEGVDVNAVDEILFFVAHKVNFLIISRFLF